MRPSFQISPRKLLFFTAIGFLPVLASAQTSAQPGPATPPANLRAIFASPFASKLASAATAVVSITPGGIVPVYSTNTTIQSGEWISIYGNNLATGLVQWQGDFPTCLPESFPCTGTSVTINGVPAYLEFADSTQINAQVPDFPAGTSGTVNVTVNTAGGGSATSTVTLGQVGPSFLLLGATEHVAAIILRSDGSGADGGGTYDIVGPTGSSLGFATKAAKVGDLVEIYAVGFGPTNPAVASGQPFSGAAALTSSVTLTINGTPVTPSFAGLSAAGLVQFNVTIPSGLGTGDVPLVATVDGVQTPSGVLISLQ